MKQLPKRAVLYRMVMPEHICPYGLKSLDLLKRQGYEVEDHHLTSHAMTEVFKKAEGVKTTPQTFIEGRRIGGHDDLRAFFDHPVKAKDAVSYMPVVALFGMAAALALAISWDEVGGLLLVQTLQRFVAIAMCLLALQKLRDVESFSTLFLNYDLLARRWVRYAYLYPFAEGLAGLLMLADVAPWLSVPLALFIGTVGAVSVIKAVYVDKRELKCACVGGDSAVPLGFVSLTENLMMAAMALWMASRAV
ncbi:glutaredoxin [Pelomonas saccharophila]|uniref:Methylamine utilization protein MauE n=1 Tax=Roseateles saccharophilus TaxID=304 RepID=A0ABU1YKB4_ROSSA|nr:glutaredoxin [Roseateles saccharophilus]MDR7268626.1 glutaredoxin [Roseateles saccharophilus]